MGRCCRTTTTFNRSKTRAASFESVTTCSFDVRGLTAWSPWRCAGPSLWATLLDCGAVAIPVFRTFSRPAIARSHIPLVIAPYRPPKGSKKRFNRVAAKYAGQHKQVVLLSQQIPDASNSRVGGREQSLVRYLDKKLPWSIGSFAKVLKVQWQRCFQPFKA